jgi:hypothetical protein
LIRLAARHPTWVLGCPDEVWWSRLALPTRSSGAEVDPPERRVERAVATDDPESQARACAGLLVRAARVRGGWQAGLPAARKAQTWLRCGAGRPLSAITSEDLAWCCAKLAAAGQAAWRLSWDHAPWHLSRAVRAGLRAHNRPVKPTGRGVRMVPGSLPIPRPWRTPLAPQWAHGHRRVVEPARRLATDDLLDRVCTACDCPPEPPLAMHHAVA